MKYSWFVENGIKQNRKEPLSYLIGFFIVVILSIVALLFALGLIFEFFGSTIGLVIISFVIIWCLYEDNKRVNELNDLYDYMEEEIDWVEEDFFKDR